MRVALSCLAVLLLGASASAQSPDPRTQFLDTLGRFSLDLDGAFGDEGARLETELGELRAALERWDASIQRADAAMRADLASADAPTAVRMHMALAVVYLQRGRAVDGLRELAAATMLDPKQADAHLLRGLTYSDLTNEPSEATEPLAKSAALEPQHPIRAYVLAKHLARSDTSEAAGAALRRFQATIPAALFTGGLDSPPTPFVRLTLVPESPSLEPFFPPVAYAEAFATLARGDLAGAIAQLRTAVAADPLVTNVGSSGDVARAAAALRAGDPAAAITHLTHARDASPDNADVHRLLGLAYLANEQPSEAQTSLARSIELRPRDERTRLAVADALVDAGDYPAAERVLRDAVEAFPTSGRARYALGRVHQRQGRYPDAVRELTASLASAPLLGRNSVYQTIGALLRPQQELEAATDAFEARARLVPNSAEAHRELGVAYFERGLDDEALAELSVAIILNRNDAEAHAAVVQLHLRAGRFEDAVLVARRTLEIAPAHKQTRYALATSLLRLGRADEGAKEMASYEQLQAAEAAERTRQLELGRLRREARLSTDGQEHMKAVALLREALALAPDDVTSHLDLGIALMSAGQPADAVEQFNAAARLNATYDIHRHLADAYAAMGLAADSARERAAYERIRQADLQRAGEAGLSVARTRRDGVAPR